MKARQVCKLATEIRELADMIDRLQVIKEHGIEEDIFYECYLGYDGDDGSVDSRIGFHKEVIKAKLRAIELLIDDKEVEEYE